jgi:hypothetical protein
MLRRRCTGRWSATVRSDDAGNQRGAGRGAAWLRYRLGAADTRQQMSSLRPEVGSLRGGCGAVSGSVRMAARPHGILAVLGACPS